MTLGGGDVLQETAGMQKLPVSKGYNNNIHLYIWMNVWRIYYFSPFSVILGAAQSNSKNYFLEKKNPKKKFYSPSNKGQNCT